MKFRKTTFALALILLASFDAARAQGQRPSLSAEQQSRLLSQRLPSGAIAGTFGSYASLLFATSDVALHTDDEEIGGAELHSPFPDFYRPTLRELFDTIAVQTGSSWKYDPGRDYWVFAKPAAPKPFSVALAPKWASEERGIYTSYRPPTYPVGMDVYYYGVYSSDDPRQQVALWEKIRGVWAPSFASHLKRGVSVAEMRKVNVAGAEALYFETPAPRPGVTWRQWAFVKDGKAFVIVSSLPAEDKTLLADVEAMVKSFQVKP